MLSERSQPPKLMNFCSCKYSHCLDSCHSFGIRFAPVSELPCIDCEGRQRDFFDRFVRQSHALADASRTVLASMFIWSLMFREISARYCKDCFLCYLR